jgi:hypothetical protein
MVVVQLRRIERRIISAIETPPGCGSRIPVGNAFAAQHLAVGTGRAL